MLDLPRLIWFGVFLWFSLFCLIKGFIVLCTLSWLLRTLDDRALVLLLRFWIWIGKVKYILPCTLLCRMSCILLYSLLCGLLKVQLSLQPVRLHSRYPVLWRSWQGPYFSWAALRRWLFLCARHLFICSLILGFKTFPEHKVLPAPPLLFQFFQDNQFYEAEVTQGSFHA